jgi:hypothetical protein
VKPSLIESLAPQFTLFRQGHLSAEQLQGKLADVAHTLPLSTSSPFREVLEQANARIDFIILGVCEAERDAHINDLLQELEVKLAL